MKNLYCVFIIFNFVVAPAISPPVTSLKFAIADSILNFYKKTPCTFQFVQSYYSANGDDEIKKGMMSVYKRKDVFFRISLDTLIYPHSKMYIGDDICHNAEFTGCNSLRDSTYWDLSKDEEQFKNMVVFYQPDYVFQPDSFKKQFSNTKKYSISFHDNPLKNFYEMCSTDRNVYRFDMLKQTKSTIKYTISKKDFRVLSFRYYCEYTIDHVPFKDSTITFYTYQNIAKEEIIKNIEEFQPFKKKDTIDEAQQTSLDTLSVFPNFILADENGVKYNSVNCQSKYTLVELWYRGCLPCMKNIQKLSEIRKNIDKSLLEILAINDVDDFDEDLKSFIKKFETNYTFLFNGQDVQKTLNITAHPATFIYNTKTRKVVYFKSGTCEHYVNEIVDFMKSEIN